MKNIRKRYMSKFKTGEIIGISLEFFKKPFTPSTSEKLHQKAKTYAVETAWTWDDIDKRNIQWN